MAGLFCSINICEGTLRPKVISVDDDNVAESTGRAVPQIHMC
jgi:hypothetical protein